MRGNTHYTVEDIESTEETRLETKVSQKEEQTVYIIGDGPEAILLLSN